MITAIIEYFRKLFHHGCIEHQWAPYKKAEMLPDPETGHMRHTGRWLVTDQSDWCREPYGDGVFRRCLICGFCEHKDHKPEPQRTLSA